MQSSCLSDCENVQPDFWRNPVEEAAMSIKGLFLQIFQLFWSSSCGALSSSQRALIWGWFPGQRGSECACRCVSVGVSPLGCRGYVTGEHVILEALQNEKDQIYDFDYKTQMQGKLWDISIYFSKFLKQENETNWSISMISTSCGFYHRNETPHILYAHVSFILLLKMHL